MSMLQPESVLRFGKYKGRTVLDVCETDPGYLCWLRQTGFSDFGKEITEFIFAWEEANPSEVLSIKRNVERHKKEDAAKRAALVLDAEEKSRIDIACADDSDDEPLHNPVLATMIPKDARPDWGSW